MNRIALYILLITLTGCTKKSELPIVDVFGHAGTSLHKEKSIYPSNSLETIKYAIDILDADGVEIDIQMTKDSVLVLYHDPFIEESAGFDGCVSEYNYDEIKDLELENTDYKIVRLNDVLLFMQSKNKLVYLDVKDYDYCNGAHVSASAFQYALDESFNGIIEVYKSNIILGMLNINLLNEIKYPSKCFENSNVIQVIENAKTNDINSVLFHQNLITETESELLNASGLYWGVFGVKDKWSIESAISFQPKFVITDNIAFTKQISN